jgi:hypothetical protein
VRAAIGRSPRRPSAAHTAVLWRRYRKHGFGHERPNAAMRTNTTGSRPRAPHYSLDLGLGKSRSAKALALCDQNTNVSITVAAGCFLSDCHGSDPVVRRFGYNAAKREAPLDVLLRRMAANLQNRALIVAVPRSFRTESFHWVDIRCAPRRDVSSGERSRNQ